MRSIASLKVHEYKNENTNGSTRRQSTSEVGRVDKIVIISLGFKILSYLKVHKEKMEIKANRIKAESTTEKTEQRHVFDTFEFVHISRQRAGSKISQVPEGIELDHLLRTTRALILTNQEILERCTKMRTIVGDGVLPFSRVSIADLRIEGESAISFFIQPEITTKDFGMPPSIPLELSELLFVPQASKGEGLNEFVGFPDYLLYLEKATLLHDEVLLSFLFKLKEHLESVHVFLGGIETWLMDPYRHAAFLEDLFGKKVTVPDIDDLLTICAGKCCTVQHPKLSPCLNCNQKFGLHHRDAYTNRITHLCNCTGYGSFKVPQPLAGKVKLLVSPSSNATHIETFNLDSERDKRRLKKFLDYVLCD